MKMLRIGIRRPRSNRLLGFIYVSTIKNKEYVVAIDAQEKLHTGLTIQYDKSIWAALFSYFGSRSIYIAGNGEKYVEHCWTEPTTID